MFNDSLIEINQLLEILGYSDLRSVMTWASKNKAPLVVLGTRTFVARNCIDHIIEKQINSFVHKNYENPAEILAAVKANDNEEFSKLIDAPPADAEVKITMKKNTVKNGKAAQRLLDKFKNS